MNAVDELEDVDARSIVTSRVFDAPRELVFEAFTKPEHVTRWWGPRGFSTTTQEMDVRAGGVWRFVMHGPDGTDYKNRIVYSEVVRPERLVYAHAGEDEHDHIQFAVTTTFEEEGAKTRVTMRSVFASAAERNRVAEEYGAIEGARQTLERLGEQVSRMATPPFVISRTFDAPRELMWKVWTDAEHLLHWFGPKGMPMFHSKNDLRRDGTFHYGLRMPGNAGEMWARWTYREIVPPQRLVFVSSFSDPDANLKPAPFADEWPLEMLTTVTLDETDGKTTVTIESTALTATDVGRETFAKNHASMTGGWTGTFEQLESYLARVQS
jgi:uncharacterized protein YndB with AHSA1/START domain